MRGDRRIIIGGGIGGLCAAIALREAGREVELYARAGDLRQVGAGLSLLRLLPPSLAERQLRHLVGFPFLA